jgi:FlaA1/EpsC-like NDP-sugar epimerase
MTLTTGSAVKATASLGSGRRALPPLGGPRGIGLNNARSGRRTWSQRYGRRIMVTDAGALVLAAIGVHLIEVPNRPTAVSTTPSYLPYVALTAALVVGWMAVLSWSGSRDGTVTGLGHVEYKRVIQSSLSLFGLVAIVSFMLQLDLPRSYMLIMLPVGLVTLVSTRYVWRQWLHHKRDSGRYMSRVIAVGDRHTVTELLQDLDRAPRAGYRVVGVCIAPDAPSSLGVSADDVVRRPSGSRFTR